MLKKSHTPVAFSLLLTLASPLKAQCPLGTETIPIGQLIPTQLEFSRLAAEDIYQRFLEDGTRRGSLMESFRSRYEARPLPVVVGPAPSGAGHHYYLLDNHHTAIPLQMAVDQGLLAAEEAMVCVEVRQFKGRSKDESWQNFVHLLHQNGVGYFGLATTNQIREQSLSLEEAYGELYARKLTQLQNNPLRGGVGKILSADGVKGRYLVDYIEFLVAERLALAFPNFKDTAGVEELAELRSAIWGDPTMLAFLKAHARSAAVQTKVNALVDIAERAWHGLDQPVAKITNDL